MANYLPFWMLSFIFPVEDPNYTRDRPLQVLALALGRTGTESLQAALRQLGYDDVYHGWHIIGVESGSTRQWTRLCLTKYSDWYKDLSLLNRTEFDKVLGHCEAVTDQ